MFKFRPDEIRVNPGIENVFANAEISRTANPNLINEVVDTGIINRQLESNLFNQTIGSGINRPLDPTQTFHVLPAFITPGVAIPPPTPANTVSQNELLLLVNAIPIAHDGDVITKDYFNTMRDAMIAIVHLLLANAQPNPTPTQTFPTITFPTFTRPTLTIPTTFPTFTRPTITITRTFPTRFFNVANQVEPINELGLLPGIGTSEKELLTNSGVTDVAALSNATPEAISQVLNTDHESAANLIGLARTFRNGQ